MDDTNTRRLIAASIFLLVGIMFVGSLFAFGVLVTIGMLFALVIVTFLCHLGGTATSKLWDGVRWLMAKIDGDNPGRSRGPRPTKLEELFEEAKALVSNMAIDNEVDDRERATALRWIAEANQPSADRDVLLPRANELFSDCRSSFADMSDNKLKDEIRSWVRDYEEEITL